MFEFSRIHKWPSKIMIIEPRADGSHFIRFDKGRRFLNKEGEHYYLIKKEHQMTKGFNFDKFYNNMLILYRKTKDELVPCEIKDDKITPIDQDMKFWLVQKYRYNRARYNKQSFFDKYGGYIMMAIMVMFLIIIISMTFNGLKDMTVNMNKMADTLNAASNTLANAISSSGSTTTAGTPPF